MRKEIKKVAKKTTVGSDPQLDYHEELLRNITKTNALLKETNSYWFIFKQSIFRGLGTAVGASLVFALFIYFMDLLIKWLDYIPILSPIIDYINQWIIKYLSV